MPRPLTWLGTRTLRLPSSLAGPRPALEQPLAAYALTLALLALAVLAGRLEVNWP